MTPTNAVRRRAGMAANVLSAAAIDLGLAL